MFNLLLVFEISSIVYRNNNTIKVRWGLGSTSYYVAIIIHILCAVLGGLMYVRQWNNMQYASSAAFLLAVYSDYLSQAKAMVNCPEGAVKPQELFDFAKSQVLTVK